jgi:hypothetical protein
VCMVGGKRCSRRGLQIVPTCNLPLDDDFDPLLCNHDNYVVPDNVVEPANDPQFLTGLDVREVEVQDRGGKEKVWSDIALFGEMKEWSALVS